MALTRNRYDEKLASEWRMSFLAAAGVEIYKGALVCVNSSGYLVPADDASGLRFMGFAQYGTDNPSGADGDQEVVVITRWSIVVSKAGATQADVGASAYCVDDETVALATINNVYAGLIVSVVDAGHVRLRFDAGDCAPT